MSPDPQVILAVAIVLDSSLSLGQEWPKPLVQYLTNLLRRVTDAHSPATLRLAFVGYATADTVPSPILSKRFFNQNPALLKEAIEFPHTFGIGTTNSGGNRGMAVLDGLVAALELFDGLPALLNTKVAGSYIIHFSGAPADSSRKPTWNDNFMMDDIDWDSLPKEMKKRNINYNVLSTPPLQGRLSEFYTAMNGNTNPSNPWFDLRPRYTLYAASVIALPTKGPISAQHGKRASETAATVDRTPDNKRPRLQGSTDSPKLATKSATAQNQGQSSQTQSQTQNQAQSSTNKPQPPAQAQAQLPPPKQTPQVAAASASAPAPQAPIAGAPQAPPMLRFPANVTSAEAYQTLGQLEALIQKLETDIADARLAQTPEKLEALVREHAQRKELYNKMKMAIDMHFKMSQPPPSMSNAPQNPQQSPPNNPPAGHSSPPNPSGALAPPDLKPHMQHNRSLSSAGSIPSTTPTLTPAMPNMPPNSQNLSVQMQKMIEQKQRSQQATPNLSIAGLPSHAHSLSGGQMAVDSNSFPGPSNAAGGANNSGQNQPEWSGVLKWSGTGPTGKKEMQCAAIVSSVMHIQKAHIETWPSVMVLIPAPEQFLLSDMHEFIKKHQPCVAMFKPATTDTDNQNHYKSLIQLLVNKRIFATSSWPTPSGQISRNIIFFPHTQHSILAGAVFPVTGLPALPKAAPSIPPALANLPPQAIQMLQQLPQDQRQAFLTRILQQNMAQQQQAAAAAQLQNQNDTGPPSMPQQQAGHNNLAAALNMMGGSQAVPNPMTSNTNAPGGMPVPTRLNPGNVPGNFSYEMLQSFMQRNAGDGMPKS